jgi:hypothetical protein
MNPTEYLSVDFSEFDDAMRELASLFEPLDILERVPSELRRLIHDALFGGRIEELVDCGAVATTAADDWGCFVRPSGALNGAIATLRTLQREFSHS